jgi:uncharacterized protein
MQRALLSVFSAIMFVPGVVRGAGFDCAAASTAREHLVCDAKELSAAVEQLNQMYAVALGRLLPDGRRMLRQGQLGWLGYVDAEFTPAALSALNRARVICREGTSRENGTTRIRLPKPSRCAW